MAQNRGFVQAFTAQEVIEKEKESIEGIEKIQEDIISNLAEHIDKKWKDAKDAKEPFETAMLDSIRQRKGEYNPVKLSKIKDSEQPEIFMNITETKCRNATAWIKDIVMINNERIFDVEPTPVPELPDFIMQKIQDGVIEKFVNYAVMEATQTGMMPSPEMLRSAIVEQADEISETTFKEITKMARKMADRISDKIDDDFVQGGFYKALDECIDDIVGLKCGFIKGPIFIKDRIKVPTFDQMGRIRNVIQERIIPTYRRRSPFCIFPSPRSTEINNGYLFDVISVKPSKLYDLIGIPGYNEVEIRDVLKEFNAGILTSNWLELSEDAKEGLGLTKADDSMDSYPEETIYCLELHDEIEGSLLQEWGLEVEDEDAYYPCVIWKIGKHIIKAMLNYDSLGRKPFSKTSFQKVNDSFWGRDIPELIEDCQQVCNACARSILANIGIGALPQVGLNVDRLEPNATRKIWPGKVWPFTEEQMASNVPPVIFWQPTMVTEKLMNVYSVFSKIADEHSGVPAYAHGDSQVGGAGNTSSGLSMLINQASRGIKAVVRNIDSDLIADRVEFHYDYLLDNHEIYGLLGDYKIKAKGSSALLALEQQTTRKIEYLARTGNPIDVELLGVENRRKMLFEVAKSLGITLDEKELMPKQIPLQQTAPPENPQTLDVAGNPAQGVEARQFNAKGDGQG